MSDTTTYAYKQDEMDLAGYMILTRAYYRLRNFSEGGELLLSLRSSLDSLEPRTVCPMSLMWLMEVIAPSATYTGIKEAN